MSEHAIEKSVIAELNKLDNEINTAGRNSVLKGIRAGQILTQAKTKLGHGKWLAWLDINTEISERTAQRYIRCWENREKLKSAIVADLTQADKLISDAKQREK